MENDTGNKFDTELVENLCLAEESTELPAIKEPAELVNVEQPTIKDVGVAGCNIEGLFWHLTSTKKELAEKCLDIDEAIELLQMKRDKIAAQYADKISTLENMIREDILKQEKSFKCPYGSASFKKAHERTSWDSKKLEGMALLIPKIQECKTVTRVEASVSLKVGY